MKTRKDLKEGDLVIYKPQRYCLESQPFTIISVDEVWFRLKNEWQTIYVKKGALNILPVEPDIPLVEQYDFFKKSMTKCDKTWNNLLVSEYYRRYCPSYGGDGFVYYKITNKEAPDPAKATVNWRVYYKVKGNASGNPAKDRNYLVKSPDEKIWGRNFKLISKLEGLIRMGE